METKNNKNPRIVREIEIDLGNDNILCITDMFTEVNRALNDENSCLLEGKIVEGYSKDDFTLDQKDTNF